MSVIDEVSVMEKDAAGSGLCAGTAFTQLRYRQNTSNKTVIRQFLSVRELRGPGERYELDYFLCWEQVSHIDRPACSPTPQQTPALVG